MEIDEEKSNWTTFFEDAVVARKGQYEMIELWNECSSEK
jgi:hypothetical protein